MSKHRSPRRLPTLLTHDDPTVQAAAAKAAKRTLWQGLGGAATAITLGVGASLAGVDWAVLTATTGGALVTAAIAPIAAYFSILAAGVPTEYTDTIPFAEVTLIADGYSGEAPTTSGHVRYEPDGGQNPPG